MSLLPKCICHRGSHCDPSYKGCMQRAPAPPSIEADKEEVPADDFSLFVEQSRLFGHRGKPDKDSFQKGAVSGKMWYVPQLSSAKTRIEILLGQLGIRDAEIAELQQERDAYRAALCQIANIHGVENTPIAPIVSEVLSKYKKP